MKNSIGLDSHGCIGVANSEGRLVCFGHTNYRPAIRTIQRDAADDPWVTSPLEALLIPGEFL